MRHQPDRPRRIRSGAWALSAAALALAGALGLLGFLAFAAFATRAPPADSPLADGIVVLTGGEQRIFEAARLLEQGKGQRLLVSGVFRHTSEAALRKLTELPRSRFACCVDIGRDALDTIGNAAETDAWVRQHGFRSIIVVTASYHMPPSLLELGRAMPDVVLHPHPVLPQQFREAPWWLQAASTKLLISE